MPALEKHGIDHGHDTIRHRQTDHVAAVLEGTLCIAALVSIAKAGGLGNPCPLFVALNLVRLVIGFARREIVAMLFARLAPHHDLVVQLARRPCTDRLVVVFIAGSGILYVREQLRHLLIRLLAVRPLDAERGERAPAGGLCGEVSGGAQLVPHPVLRQTWKQDRKSDALQMRIARRALRGLHVARHLSPGDPPRS